jgi:hypothetical protein
VFEQFRAAQTRELGREPRARRRVSRDARTTAERRTLAAPSQRDEAAPPGFEQRRAQADLAPQGAPDFARDAQSVWPFGVCAAIIGGQCTNARVAVQAGRARLRV